MAVALAIVLAASGFAAQAFDEAGGEPAADECQCYFPNSGSYGRYDSGGHCVKQECWVRLKVE